MARATGKLGAARKHGPAFGGFDDGELRFRHAGVERVFVGGPSRRVSVVNLFVNGGGGLF